MCFGPSSLTISLLEQGKYLLFDFPGQVELYTHLGSLKNILEEFSKWHYRVRFCFGVRAARVIDVFMLLLYHGARLNASWSPCI